MKMQAEQHKSCNGLHGPICWSCEISITANLYRLRKYKVTFQSDQVVSKWLELIKADLQLQVKGLQCSDRAYTQTVATLWLMYTYSKAHIG